MKQYVPNLSHLYKLFILLFGFAFLGIIEKSSAQVYTLVDTVGIFPAAVKQVVFHPDNKTIAVCCSTKNEVYLYHADSNKLLKTYSYNLGGEIEHISFNEDGKYLCGAYQNGSVAMFETKSGKFIKSFYPSGKITSTQGLKMRFVFLGKSEETLYFGGDDNQVTMIKNPLKLPASSVIATTKEPIQAGAIRKDRALLAYSSANLLYVRDLISGKLTVIPAASDEIRSVSFANDNTRIAAKCKNRNIDFWNYRTAEKIQIIKSSNEPIVEDVSQVALSNDNRYVVSGSVSVLPQVWDDDYRQLYNLVAHKERVNAVDFSGDSKMIATGSDDKMVYIWYITDGQYTTEQIKNYIRHPEWLKVKEKKLQSPEGEGEATVSFSGDNIPLDINGRNIKPSQTVIVRSKNITFYVWDDDQADGDIISLYFNNQWILNNFKLTKGKKIVNAKIDPESNNYILLYAHNEGSIPPNTCGISIFDGYKETRLQLKSDLKTCDAVRLLFKTQ